MRRFVTGIVFAGMAAVAFAENRPQPGPRDSRIRTAIFSADEVYRITGFVGYELHLEFESGESFVGLAAGDLEGLGFSAVENNLFLKPKASGVGTNLTVVTSRRRYHFDYVVATRRPGASSEDVIYSVRFRYPDTEKLASLSAEVDEALDGSSRRPLNLDYWFCGNSAVKPSRAFDDGVQTHLEFPPRAEWPAVFSIDEHGGESLLNFSVKGSSLVIHRVSKRLVLRRGKATGCVVNKSFDGGSSTTQTGTVTDRITRTVEGERRD